MNSTSDSNELDNTTNSINFEHRNNNRSSLTVISGPGNFVSVSLASAESSENDQNNLFQIQNLLRINEEKSVSQHGMAKRKWYKVGYFDSEKEMFRGRLKGHVSKWKMRKISGGLKIFYRCNKFKHFGCGYRMYAEICGQSQIVLYESGCHDHSTRKKFKYLGDFLKNFLSVPV